MYAKHKLSGKLRQGLRIELFDHSGADSDAKTLALHRVFPDHASWLLLHLTTSAQFLDQ